MPSMNEIKTLPRELNGYPVKKIETHETCATVMVERSDSYVVATWWPDLGESWMWGHYHHESQRISNFQAYQNAASDFRETAKRNATR